MGIWWKNVSHQTDEGQIPPENGISTLVKFAGDPTAISKELPIVWRYGQDWQGMEVHCQEGLDAGYRLYFYDGFDTMRYYKTLHQRYIMARIGRESLTFWALAPDKKLLYITKSGVMVPRKFGQPAFSSEDSQPYSLIERDCVWV